MSGSAAGGAVLSTTTGRGWRKPTKSELIRIISPFGGALGMSDSKPAVTHLRIITRQGTAASQGASRQIIPELLATTPGNTPGSVNHRLDRARCPVAVLDALPERRSLKRKCNELADVVMPLWTGVRSRSCRTCSHREVEFECAFCSASYHGSCLPAKSRTNVRKDAWKCPDCSLRENALRNKVG